MPIFRKIAIGIVLASYLFANTFASSFHDHGDCCTHSGTTRHDTTGCSKADLHREGGKHCCHHHHNHSHKPAPVVCQNAGTKLAADCKPGRPPCGQKRESGVPCGSHHCVVCDFLAIVPLAAAPVTLLASGEILPEFVVFDVVPVSGTTIETHLARGPPAV